MRRLFLVCIMAITACADSPIRPSAPPSSAPPKPAAKLEIVPGDMAFSGFDQAQGWTFTGQGRNVGDGCAGSVTGVVLFLNGSGAELQTVRFELGSRVVKPAEVFPFEACCLLAQHSKTAATARVQFSFQTVACG